MTKSKSGPALLGSSLRSKPTWWNAFGQSTTSAFFVNDSNPKFATQEEASRKVSASISRPD